MMHAKLRLRMTVLETAVLAVWRAEESWGASMPSTHCLTVSALCVPFTFCVCWDGRDLWILGLGMVVSWGCCLFTFARAAWKQCLTESHSQDEAKENEHGETCQHFRTARLEC